MNSPTALPALPTMFHSSPQALFSHILMGGFVEPDEEKLNQAKNVTKLRVFAAGSYTNAVLGVLCIFLLFNFSATIAPFYTVVSSGVAIGSVPANLPAYFWAASRRCCHEHKWNKNREHNRPASLHVRSCSRARNCGWDSTWYLLGQNRR